jgi:hypothetical protein
MNSKKPNFFLGTLHREDVITLECRFLFVAINEHQSFIIVVERDNSARRITIFWNGRPHTAQDSNIACTTQTYIQLAMAEILNFMLVHTVHERYPETNEAPRQ